MNRLLALLAFFLVTNVALAQQLKVVPYKLVIVKRSDITTQQQLDLFLYAIERTKEVGVRIKIVQIVEVDDEVNQNHFDYYWNRLFLWDDWSKRKRLKKRGTHIHFLLPPVWKDGLNYGGGAAGAICSTTRNLHRQFSYSIMRLKNIHGQDRVDNSIVATLHEVLHSLGANHVRNKQNVMNPEYIPGPQPILPITKRQVRDCFNVKMIEVGE